MSETVEVCPECDTTAIYSRSGGHRGRTPRDAPAYGCHNCGALFDEPVERARKTNAGGHRGVGKLLESADPEEWP